MSFSMPMFLIKHAKLEIPNIVNESKCVQECKKQVNVTGCEFDKEEKEPCKYHTKPVFGGSEHSKDVTCWVFLHGKKISKS